MVRVQAFRQPSQDGLIGIGGHAVDDELSASDAECDRRAVREQLVGSSEDVLHPGVDRRVVARIHRIAMEGHRHRHEKRVQIAFRRGSVRRVDAGHGAVGSTGFARTSAYAGGPGHLPPIKKQVLFPWTECALGAITRCSGCGYGLFR